MVARDIRRMRLSIVGAVLAFAGVALAGCVSSAERAYLTRIAPLYPEPVTVTVARDSADVVLDRARLWIVDHGTLPIVTATDALIATETAKESPPFYGITVTRISETATVVSFRVAVAAHWQNHDRERAIASARHLAHFMATGEQFVEPTE